MRDIPESVIRAGADGMDFSRPLTQDVEVVRQVITAALAALAEYARMEMALAPVLQSPHTMAMQWDGILPQFDPQCHCDLYEYAKTVQRDRAMIAIQEDKP